MNTRVKIDLNQGIIEIEGSENFVREKLDKYEEKVFNSDILLNNKRAPVTLIEDYVENRTELTENKSKKKKNVSVKPRAIKSERFDYLGENGKENLEDFFQRKNPGKNNQDIIVTIGYYIQYILQKSYFTEGNIEFAYKILNLKRPVHLTQIMRNTKSQRDLLIQKDGIEGGWELTRAGELFVSDKLPLDDK